MNKLLIALAAGAFALGAYAAGDTQKTRSEVKMEASNANVSGEIAHGAVDPLVMRAQAKLSKEEMDALRAMIKSEAKTAVKKGEVGSGEANSLAFTAQAKLTKKEMSAVRSMVKAEAAKANMNGTIEMGNK